MLWLLLLLSALAGLGEVSGKNIVIQKMEKVIIPTSDPFMFFGKSVSKLYVSTSPELSICMDGYNSKKECLKFFTKVNLPFQSEERVSDLNDQKIAERFIRSVTVTSTLELRMLMTDGVTKVNIYFLSAGKQSGIYVATSMDVTMNLYKNGIRGPSIKIKSDKGIDVSSCRASDGSLFKASEPVKIGCQTETCDAQYAVTVQNCGKDQVCLKGNCVKLYKKVCTFTGPSGIDARGISSEVKDRCQYTLFTTTLMPELSVKADYKDRRRGNVVFLDSVTIKVGSDTYLMEQGGRFQAKGSVVTFSSKTMKFGLLSVTSEDSGLTASYSKEDYTVGIFFDGYTAQITIKGPTGKVVGMKGLCSNINSNVADVRLTKDSCDVKHKDVSVDPLITVEKAKERCGIMKNAPFNKCHPSISVEPYVNACEATLKAYPPVDNLPCHFLEAYARACLWWTDKKVEGWRSNSKCPTAPKILCKDTFCASEEFCSEKEHTGGFVCSCRHIFSKKHRDDKTLGKPTTCDKNKASASLINCLLREKGIDYTTLHLTDDTCKGTLDDGIVTFEFSSDKMCGAVIKEESTQTVYKNFIKSAKSTEKITRQDQVNIEFSCNQDQPKVQTVTFNVQSSSVLTPIISGSWKYELTMKVFSDVELKQPATSVQMNDRVWVELKTTGLDAKLVAIVIDSCWATKEKKTDAEPKYDLITESCPKDKTMVLKDNGKGLSGSFSFKTFQFTSSTAPSIFLHCKVKLCTIKEGKTCVKTCKGKRRRRFASFMEEDSAPAIISMAWTT
ncbi:uncharacterized protein LOC117808825 [Notolabrus celidotus]|uniref:uncharacterized protein LOC117808825 n=1 Tax=Notolabrus celidotus TaxID=1203425 RepID=UPI001490036A|nr:uncharacterized protein LOC117808825 [Notolabrus celidotus]